MKLVDIYTDETVSAVLLWQLMAEREPDQNISHKGMPTVEQHAQFMQSHPYLAWYAVVVDGRAVGAVYLSKFREIGIAILKAHRGHGHGKRAVQMLIERHPGKFLANINPRNSTSARLFHQLGFEHAQNTFVLEDA